VLLASGDLARRLIIARGGCVGHQKLLNGLSDVDLLIIDDFLTVGI
jgi:DNA replication protein DnaC